MISMDNELFDCDICCEQFSETGAHVPLVLPCGHTLCRQCVGRLHNPECPTCKHPLQSVTTAGVTGTSSMIFPRNNWLIRCLLAQQSSSKKQHEQPLQLKTMSRGSILGGQRVLFKQLDRACKRSDGERPNSHRFSYSCAVGETARTSGLTAEQRLHDEKHQERLFLLNLSRICKEKKARDSSFDQKRFVKEGLILKFGETKAKSIMHQVFDRIKMLREERLRGV